MTTDHPLARYQRVKKHICDRIDSGEWRAGDRVPSEHELVRDLGVSRMTANRAVRELAAEGYLTRVQGVGTFVADRRVQSEVVQIRNIAEEIAERGHRHGIELVELTAVKASAAIAEIFDLELGTKVFHSVVVHHENDVPIQIEDRYVNPAVAPNYLSVDFAQTTTNEYLVEVAPISEVRHIIEAVMPDRRVRKLLRIGEDEACLRLFRQVLSGGVPASCAWLTHPGSRFRMTAQFVPSRVLSFERAPQPPLRLARSS
jgi:GntR family transcriptional regulator, histidine utilization repressor